jgi:sec-independent protein translocase protein TatB
VNTNLTISEILTIAVVILIVFGPERLPEMARKAGELLARLRGAANSLRTEFTREYEDIAKPFKDIEAELTAAKDELKSVRDDAQAALPDLNAAAPSAEEPLPVDGPPVEPEAGDPAS